MLTLFVETSLLRRAGTGTSPMHGLAQHPHAHVHALWVGMLARAADGTEGNEGCGASTVIVDELEMPRLWLWGLAGT